MSLFLIFLESSRRSDIFDGEVWAQMRLNHYPRTYPRPQNQPQNSPEQLTTLVGKSVGSGEGTRQYPLKVLSASQVGHTQRTHRNLPWMSCILKFRSLKIPLVEPSFSHGEKTEISREASWDALKIYVQLPYYRKLRYWKIAPIF